MQKRISLLFVSDSFQQSGGERHLVEIIKGLKRFHPEVFDIHFLLYAKVFEKKVYHETLTALNVNIHFLSSVNKRLNPFLMFVDRLTKRILNRLHINFRFNIEKKFNKLSATEKIEILNGFDLIIINKIFLLKGLQNYFKENTRIIHHAIIHNLQYNESPYKGLNVRNINVTYPCMQMKREMQYAFGDNIGLSRFIDMPAEINIKTAIKKKASASFRIAFLGRINYDKPLMLPILIVNELVKLGENVECSIIGRVENFGIKVLLQRSLKIMGLESIVQFVDHIDSMEELHKMDIDLVVAGSIDNFIGYSSIEVIAEGIPVVFFNQVEQKYITTEDLISVVRYPTINSLAAKIGEYCSNQSSLVALIENQQKHILETHDLESVSSQLKNFYSAVYFNC